MANTVFNARHGLNAANLLTSNTTVVLVGANIAVSTVSITIGNTIANTFANSITVKLINATSNTVITPGALSIGNSTVNASLTPTTMQVGNSGTGLFVTATGNVGVNKSTPALDFFVDGSSGATIGTLTDGANMAVDLGTFNNFSVTLNGNRNVDNPTNLLAGQSGVLLLSQNSTGGQVPTWGSFWKFPSNTVPSLSTSASKTDAIVFFVTSSTKIVAKEILDIG